MPDFTTRARETAEREAETEPASVPELQAFVSGALWAVSRLPSEEEIELTILGLTATAGARAVRELIEKKMLES